MVVEFFNQLKNNFVFKPEMSARTYIEGDKIDARPNLVTWTRQVQDGSDIFEQFRNQIEKYFPYPNFRAWIMQTFALNLLVTIRRDSMIPAKKCSLMKELMIENWLSCNLYETIVYNLLMNRENSFVDKQAFNLLARTNFTPFYSKNGKLICYI